MMNGAKTVPDGPRCSSGGTPLRLAAVRVAGPRWKPGTRSSELTYLYETQERLLAKIYAQEKPSMTRLLNSADDDLRQTRTLLQELQRLRGRWRVDPATKWMSFDSTATRDAMQRLQEQVVRSHQTVLADLKSWSDWRAAQKRQ